MGDKSELVMSFAKNSLEEVRVSISEYKGRRYLSLWVFYKTDDDVWQPSKKGLVLPLDLLDDLKKAIDTALARVCFEAEAKTQKRPGETETGKI